MSGPALDLSKLPPPAAIEQLSFAQLVADIKADLLTRAPSLALALSLPSEPTVKLIEAFAYREGLLRNRINRVAQANTLAHSYGADLDVAAANLAVARLEGESDEDLRARAVLAPEGWSSAGPERAYEFWARSAHHDVADVAVSSPDRGEVRVVVLSREEDGVASPELLQAVDGALNAEEIRPLTDAVEVVSAGVAAWSVEAVLKVRPGPDGLAALEAAEAAIWAYGAQRRRLNQFVSHKAVIGALMPPGVEDLELVSPADDIDALDEVAPVLVSVDLSIEVIP